MEHVDQNGKWIVEDGVSYLIEPSNEYQNTNQQALRISLNKIRNQRNELLNEVDIKYCNAEKWELFTDEQKTLWRAYKQQLRDLPETIDLDTPVFPTKPE